jgi:hypothetical protein
MNSMGTHIHRLLKKYNSLAPYLKRYIIINFKRDVKASCIQPEEDLRKTEDLPCQVYSILGSRMQEQPLYVDEQDEDGNMVYGLYCRDRDILSFNVAFPDVEEQTTGKLPKKGRSKVAKGYANRRQAPTSPSDSTGS